MNKKDFNQKTFIVTAYKNQSDKKKFLESGYFKRLTTNSGLLNGIYDSFGQWIDDKGNRLLEQGLYFDFKQHLYLSGILLIADNIRQQFNQECVTVQHYDIKDDYLFRGLVYSYAVLNTDDKINYFNNVILGTKAINYDCFTVVPAKKLIFSFKF